MTSALTLISALVRSLIRLSEPLSVTFVDDQLRGSPLLFYSQNLDGLSQDGNRAAGVRHNVFGDEIGVGLHALNPGIAVGKLHTRPDPSHLESLDPKGIYLLPETVSDLPPIAGILTAGEGNPLSHVQLLARNLGIPNVSVNEQLTPRLDAHDGELLAFVDGNRYGQIHGGAYPGDNYTGESDRPLDRKSVV